MVEFTVKHHPSSAIPALRIEMTWEYQDRFAIPVRAEGQVKSAKGLLVGALNFAAAADNVFKAGILPQSTSANQAKRKVLFDCPLSPQAIEHILECRDANARGDVVLGVDVILWTVHPSFRVGNQGGGSVEIPFYAGQTPYGPGFGLLTSEFAASWVTIPSSDWTTDFAPAFGIGKFFTVELPDPRLTTPAPESSFGSRLARAVAAIGEMERDIRAGEWTDCIEHSRPVWEILRNTEEVKGLLIADGLSEPATDELLKVVNGGWFYASKFIHELTPRKQDLSEILTAKKEDAYYIYSTAVTLVNLVGRKSGRQPSSK